MAISQSGGSESMTTKKELFNIDDGMDEQETLCHGCDMPIPTHAYLCDTCQEQKVKA